MVEYDTMSWRRFGVLLRCLGPNSALVTRIHSKGGFQGRDPVVALQTPEQAQAAFVSMFGHLKKSESKAPEPTR